MGIYKKFNYVFFIGNQDYYLHRFFDLHYLTNVRVMHIMFNQTDRGINIFFVPVRSPNNPTTFQKGQDWAINFFDDEFPVKNPIIFIFRMEEYSGFRALNLDFFQKLRNDYPECKLVCLLNNPVFFYRDGFGCFANEKSVRDIHETFDVVMTYNKYDAEVYGLLHYGNMYSVVPHKPQKIISDVFFVGAAKNRLSKIYRTYEMLTDIGLICDFYITGVPQNLQRYPDKIHYNTPLSYDEVLNHVMASKGILEIAQVGNYGLTMRFFEALAYDKNYITDNGYINQKEFKKYPKIFCIDDWKNFKIDKNKYLAAAELSNNYRNEYSPLHFVTFLESYFNSL